MSTDWADFSSEEARAYLIVGVALDNLSLEQVTRLAQWVAARNAAQPERPWTMQLGGATWPLDDEDPRAPWTDSAVAGVEVLRSSSEDPRAVKSLDLKAARTLLSDLTETFGELPEVLGPFSDDTLDWDGVALEACLHLLANGPLPGARLCFGHPEPLEEAIDSRGGQGLPWSCPVDFEQRQVPQAGIRGLVVDSVSYDASGTRAVDVSEAAHTARASSAAELQDAKYYLVVTYGG